MRICGASWAGRQIAIRKVVAGLVPCLLGMCLGVSWAAPPDVLSFAGVCDASAAIALDAKHIIVGEYEKPSLSIYGVDGGERLAMIGLPHLTGGGEADIEGTAIFGDRIVWISSNGRGSDGKVKAKRFQFFASHRLDSNHQWVDDFSPSFGGLPAAIAATNEPAYEPLRRAVGDLSHPDPDLAPKKQGVNIEGLTISQDGEALLVGLRIRIRMARQSCSVSITPPPFWTGRPLRPSWARSSNLISATVVFATSLGRRRIALT